MTWRVGRCRCRWASNHAAAWQISDFEKFRDTLKKVENINQARSVLNLQPNEESFAKMPNPLKSTPKIGLYKSFTASMDEGWTRLVFDNFQIPYNRFQTKIFAAET